MAEAARQPTPATTPAPSSPSTAATRRLGDPAAALAGLAARAAGHPLERSVQSALESSLQVDLSPVRVHSDTRAGAFVDNLGARAVTYGVHVFLATREQPTDLPLLAHEVAHVVQQHGRPIVQLLDGGEPADPLEREAQLASMQVRSGGPASIVGRTPGPRPQAQVDEANDASWLERRAWDLLNEFFPEFVPILRQGIFEWLKDKISTSIRTVFDTLSAPVRALTSVVESVSAHFAMLLEWMRDAAARIARGDCSAISEAADKIQKVIEGIAAPILDRVKDLAAKVANFFRGLWDNYGAKVWDFLKKVGGWVWDRISQFGTWVWDKTAPIRNLLTRAWTWIKNKLGVGEGPEGQNGLLQWIQAKAGEAWDFLMAKIKPIQTPLLVVAGILALLSPAGPIIAIGAAVGGLIKGIQWIRQFLNTPDGVVQQRDVLHRTIIPAIMGAVGAVTDALGSAAKSITAKLGDTLNGMGQLVAAVGNSVLRFAIQAVQWIADQVKGLASWAKDKVSAVAEWMGTALNRLLEFFKPVLDFLVQVGRVIADILGLPLLVLGKAWRAIPACIRDPFVNFLINQILKRIPIFKQLLEVPNIWAKIKDTGTTILRQVFRDGDLKGGMLTLFKALLSVLGIPLELVTGIFSKAKAAVNQIIDNPLGFLKNFLLAIKLGFSQFADNILVHLANGLKGWLFDAARDAGVHIPQALTLQEIFTFVLDLLGLTVELVLQRLELKIGREKVAVIRKGIRVISEVWSWVSTLLKEGPQGVWNRLKEKLGDLWKALLDGTINWVVTTVTKAALKKVVTMLDPTGIMAVVNSIIAIYNAIESFVRYLRQILEIVSRVLDTALDIARGAIAGAATLLENTLDRALPVIIGFLANQVGLGDLAERIREIVEFLRAKVIEAIDWLLDKAIALGAALLGAIKAGVGAVVAWWKARMKVGEGQNEHTMYFKGGEDDAEVYIETTPTPLEDFIAGIKAHPDFQSKGRQAAIAEIEKLAPKLRDKRNDRRNAKTESEKDKLGDEIEKIFNTIGKHLAIVLKSTDYGTESNPLEIDWPGPPASKYPKMFFGGPIRHPKSQSVLQGIWSRDQKDELGVPVKRYSPTEQDYLLDENGKASGTEIGLEPHSRLTRGSVVGPLGRETTPGGGALDKLIKPYGYTSEGNYFQLDHVIEIQMGGKNEPENMWPLEASINAAKGSGISKAHVSIPDGGELAIPDLKRIDSPAVRNGEKYFFKIVKFDY